MTISPRSLFCLRVKAKTQKTFFFDLQQQVDFYWTVRTNQKRFLLPPFFFISFLLYTPIEASSLRRRVGRFGFRPFSFPFNGHNISIRLPKHQSETFSHTKKEWKCEIFFSFPILIDRLFYGGGANIELDRCRFYFFYMTRLEALWGQPITCVDPTWPQLVYLPITTCSWFQFHLK